MITLLVLAALIGSYYAGWRYGDDVYNAAVKKYNELSAKIKSKL